jgi:hypothetical protein
MGENTRTLTDEGDDREQERRPGRWSPASRRCRPEPPGTTPRRRGSECGSDGQGEGQDYAGPHNRRTGRAPRLPASLVRRGKHPVSANSGAVVGAVAMAGTAPDRTIEKRAGRPRTCAAGRGHSRPSPSRRAPRASATVRGGDLREHLLEARVVLVG